MTYTNVILLVYQILFYFLSLFYYFAGWGYTVAFTNVLTNIP
jgi:hypothetical protein